MAQYVFYNEEIKKDYIRQKKATTIYAPNYMENIFSKATTYEEMLGKDICNWTVAEGIDYFKYLNVVADSTLIGINKIFRSYTQYCIERGMSVDNQNHFLEITRETIVNECVNRTMLDGMIITREDIEQGITIFTEPSDKFLILCIFEGIAGKDYQEILNLRYSDFEKISENEYVVHTCSGRTFPVSPLLVFYAEQSSRQTTYTMDSGRYWEVYGEHLDTVIKFKDTGRDVQKKYIGRRIYQRLFKLIKKMDLTKNLTAKYLANSGQIDMFQREAAKKKITPIEAVFDNEIYDRVSYIYTRVNSRKAFVNKFRDYLEPSAK